MNLEIYHAARLRTVQCAIHYILPARLVPRHGDVASASELPAAIATAQESDDVPSVQFRAVC